MVVSAPASAYYPYMASVVGKKRGKLTYYYLVESARVDGKPRIVSQEYLATAGQGGGQLIELLAGLGQGGAVKPAGGAGHGDARWGARAARPHPAQGVRCGRRRVEPCWKTSA